LLVAGVLVAFVLVQGLLLLVEVHTQLLLVLAGLELLQERRVETMGVIPFFHQLQH
jgi:hypothetical protein